MTCEHCDGSGIVRLGTNYIELCPNCKPNVPSPAMTTPTDAELIEWPKKCECGHPASSHNWPDEDDSTRCRHCDCKEWRENKT